MQRAMRASTGRLPAPKSKQTFYKRRRFTLPGLFQDQKHIRQNLVAYIGDSPRDARMFERFKLRRVRELLRRKNRLFMLVQKFAAVDLHPDRCQRPTRMGINLSEEFIRRFAEVPNEIAGEHFTPREVARLLSKVLFAFGDDEALNCWCRAVAVRPHCGRQGGMLAAANTLAEMNALRKTCAFGQEPTMSPTLPAADMPIKGQNPEHIRPGNTLP